MTALAAGWLVAVTPTGVAVVGPAVEIAIAVPDGPATAHALARCLGAGPDADALATLPPELADEGRRLVGLLEGKGAYHDGPAGDPDGTSLAAALDAQRRDGRAPAGVVWTAEEALVLPAALPGRTRARALEAFVTGLTPDARLAAYASSSARGGVHGDAPEADRLRRRLAETAPDGDRAAEVRVVALADGGACARATAAEFDRLSAAAPHRLGPVLHVGAPEQVDPQLPGLTLSVARIAAPDAATPTSRDARTTQGVGTQDVAQRIALAEAAERYAAARPADGELMRAERAALPDAVDPLELYDGGADAAALRRAADGPRLWAPVVGHDGARRHVPAETVRLTVADAAAPEAVIPWTSSGVAAGTDLADARHRALCELIERDAFMVCWLQGSRRERIARHGVPDDATRMADVLDGHGWRTTWVNLTRDTLPVVLCCLTHEREGLTLGAACAATPAAALRRATIEALVLALRFRDDGPRPSPEAVRTPRDHLLLHRDPAREAEHAFLYDSPDEIALGDVADGDPATLANRLATLGHPPLFADLTVAACGPYRVVRALAPGLVPLTFGWGREPDAMPRVCGDGEGDRAAAARPRVPHPFP